jgi:hypothetical protein
LPGEDLGLERLAHLGRHLRERPFIVQSSGLPKMCLDLS